MSSRCLNDALILQQKSGISLIFLMYIAGSNNVKGTDVNAPIKETKSLKNGIAFAIKNDDIDTTNVRIAQRSRWYLCRENNVIR
mmetsp:Transcript_11038/g.13959  ORF Transcript_11038/g.13959 Transcript_11038/m.13959 type:complete len:84 (-) Transcript_11038:598-849(-)